MFGILSLGKLLILGALILCVWYGFRFLNARSLKKHNNNHKTDNLKGTPTKICPLCEVYQPINKKQKCNKPDCPW